ncbi:MAG: hypothetical protein J6B54_05875 [Clostridia bacterium]|nr:hypothetical protein [Clostridia bacterium]
MYVIGFDSRHIVNSSQNCFIGRRLYIHIVDKFEAVDINTEEDLKIAEHVGKVIYGL